MSPDQIEVGKTYKHREGHLFEATVLEIKEDAAEGRLVRYKSRQTSYPWGSLTAFAEWAKIVVDDKEEP
jgi:hypothetical protein